MCGIACIICIKANGTIIDSTLLSETQLEKLYDDLQEEIDADKKHLTNTSPACLSRTVIRSSAHQSSTVPPLTQLKITRAETITPIRRARAIHPPRTGMYIVRTNCTEPSFFARTRATEFASLKTGCRTTSATLGLNSRTGRFDFCINTC
jgi:hypothetical protein